MYWAVHASSNVMGAALEQQVLEPAVSHVGIRVTDLVNQQCLVGFITPAYDK